jgi:hypothetical protein
LIWTKVANTWVGMDKIPCSEPIHWEKLKVYWNKPKIEKKAK